MVYLKESQRPSKISKILCGAFFLEGTRIQPFQTFTWESIYNKDQFKKRIFPLFVKNKKAHQSVLNSLIIYYIYAVIQ